MYVCVCGGGGGSGGPHQEIYICMCVCVVGEEDLGVLTRKYIYKNKNVQIKQFYIDQKFVLTC